MTKIFDIIYLSPYIYMVDKEAPLAKGDLAFMIGLCKLEDELWKKSATIQQITGELHSYLSTSESHKYIDRYMPPKQLVKIVASTDKSLNLPILPVFEEDIEAIFKIAFPKYENINWREYFSFFEEGYKAATKKYSEEDLRKALWKAASIGYFTDRENQTTQKKMEELIQSLSPKPTKVEVEMYIKCYCKHTDKCDCGPNKGNPYTSHSPKVDFNNIVKVVKWI